MTSIEQQKKFLLTMYQATSGEESNKIYNMINVASLLLEIRTGLLLTSIRPEDTEQFLGFLHENGFVAKQYAIGNAILVIRTNASPTVQEAYARIIRPAPISFNAPIEEPNSPETIALKRNRLNLNTGTALGYLNPIPLRRALNYPTSIVFRITIRHKDVATKIGFFPQRIDSIDAHREALEVMKTRLETELPTILPDGFTLESIVLEVKGSAGGSRRKPKTKRKFKGKTQRRGRKGRGSS